MGNQSSAICDLCSRPVDGTAYACTRCGVELPTRHLATIADLTPHAREAAAGQARHTSGVGGTGTVRLELNLSAGARLDAIGSELTTWARTVHDERGGPIAQGDPITASALYLAGHLEWLRHQQQASEALRTIAACSRLLADILDGPGERRWLGQCGDGEDPCTEDLHARIGATAVTCRACGTRHDVTQRQAWLDQVALDYSYTPAEIESAYGIRANTIRVWAHRGRVVSTGSVDGQPVYPLRRVLELAGRAEVAA